MAETSIAVLGEHRTGHAVHCGLLRTILAADESARAGNLWVDRRWPRSGGTVKAEPRAPAH